MKKYYLETNWNASSLQCYNFISKSYLDKRIDANESFEIKENGKVNVHVLGLTKFDVSSFSNNIRISNIPGKIDVFAYDRNWLSSRRLVISGMFIKAKYLKYFINYDATTIKTEKAVCSVNNLLARVDSIKNELSVIDDEEKIYLKWYYYYSRFTINELQENCDFNFGLYDDIMSVFIETNDKFLGELFDTVTVHGNSHLARKYPNQIRFVPRKDFFDLAEDNMVDSYVKYDVDLTDDIKVVSVSNILSALSELNGYRPMDIEDLNSFVETVNNLNHGDAASTKVIANILANFDWKKSGVYTLYAYSKMPPFARDKFIETKRGNMIFSTYIQCTWLSGNTIDAFNYLCEKNEIHDIPEDIYRTFIEPEVLNDVIDKIKSEFHAGGSRSMTGWIERCEQFIKEHLKR